MGKHKGIGTKGIAMTLAPLATLGIAGWAIAKHMHRNGYSHDRSENQYMSLVQKTADDIDDTVMELKETLQNKSVDELDSVIDHAVDSAKQRLDKIASTAKKRLQTIRQ